MDMLTLARSFASLLLDSAAKGTILLLLACLAAWLCRRSSAALRHSIWCLTMGGLLLLPVASWALPAWQIPILPPVPAPAPVAEVVRLPASPLQGATGEGFDSPVLRRATAGATVVGQSTFKDTGGPERPPEAPSAPPVVEPTPAPASVEAAAPPLTAIEWTALLVSALWSLGVSLFSVLLLIGLWRTVNLRHTSLKITDGEWPGMLVELRQRLGLTRSVELREHAQSVVPLTWGIWRPVVLLPKLARDWDEPMRRAVLLHELAHVQRGDVACQVLGRLTCVLYWLHPLAWFALRQLRQEREQACDDAVVQSGEKASDYAEQLLQVARLCCAPRGLSLGVAMAEGSSIERRILSLFDSARSHGPLTRRVAIASFLIGGAILAGLAPLEPTASQAEPVATEASSLVETRDPQPHSASIDNNSKPTEVEPPLRIELCRKVLSEPASLQHLENMKPVYGKAKRGIQLGLAIITRSRSFAEGERLPLMLVYRNVGQEELTFHISQDHWNNPPTVIDQNGNQVQVSFVMHWMFVPPLKITLKPGEAWCEMTPGLYLGKPMPSIKPVVGKYRLTYPQGIWDVNTTPQLRTDLPALPTTIPDTSLPNPESPEDSKPAPSNPVGQVVETPNWSENLATGIVEFEIAPSQVGALEARILASLPAAGSGVTELLQKYRESRQRLEPLHVQMRHTEEYTDAFRAYHRIQAERQELTLKAIRQMKPEDFRKANQEMHSAISLNSIVQSIQHDYDMHQDFAKMRNQSVSDVELFQKGAAYQIRTRRDSNDDVPGLLSFPSEPLTAGNLGTTYQEIGFYSWAPASRPSGTIINGSQPQYRQVTSKQYHTNGARPIPVFSNFVRTGSHDWHPIDAFFSQSPESYRVTGTETLDGRELLIVEVPVATIYTGGFSKPGGGNEQLKIVHYYRAWLDLARGSLPVKQMIWHGNEKSDFASLVELAPQRVMTTQQIQEVVPGGWYPTLTTLDKYDRDAEKMPKAPASGQGEEWDNYLVEIKKVPSVVHERETWKCDPVEVPQSLADDFFVLPTPPGAKIIDRDRQDLIEDYSFGLPADELAEVGTFLGKAWLLGPLGVMPGLSEDGGAGEVPQKVPPSVEPTGEESKAGAEVPLDKVVWWGEAVDGLEPGFWLTETEDPRNLRIPMDSLVKYRVVVRNTTDKEMEFLVRLLPFDGMDVPYLIPSSQLDPKGRITPPQPAKEFQAEGAANVFGWLNAVQAITLDAGESVLLPECGLYLGKAPDEQYPQIADFVPGTHWIVQPLLVHPLAFKERGEFTRLMGRDSVTKIARDGKTRQEGVVYVTGSWDQELKPAYAKYHLEVGTLDASADRNAKSAIWGEVEQGMQCGIRILNPQPSYKIGDTLEAELLWRNTSEAVISTTRPRPLDFYSMIDDADGKHLEIDFGARYDLLPGGHDFQPGEVRSLGVTKVTLVAQGTPGPKDNEEPGHITLEPGKYKLSASGGVGNISPRSGKYEFTVVSEPAVVPVPPVASNTITGQILNEQKEGIAGADVALVAFEIVQGQLERQGRVIATTTADPLGNYSLKLPAGEADRKKFGAVWAKAEGHVAARSNWSTVIAALPERKAELTLAATKGTHVRVLDSTGKPLAGAKVLPVLVGVPQGVGYPLPKEWEEQSTGTSDAEGKAHLPHVDAEAIKGLDIVPPGDMGIMRYGQNHFLNIRPQKEGDQHFEFQMPETGSVTGQLVVSPGSTLPKDLKISLESYIKPHSLSQAVITVPVDAEGKFRVEKLAAGWLCVPEFLPADQPLRADVAGRIEVRANEELQLKIPVAPGIRIRGQVRKSDTQEGVPKYPVSVIYGQAVRELSSDFRQMKFEIETDAEGRFECVVPPGPINVNTSRYVDGYSSANSWLPDEARGHWGGMRFVVPAQESFDLGPIELIRNVGIQGQVVDMQKQPLVDWSVYGYPNVPEFDQSSTMNSMAGVHTDKQGIFKGSYPQTYPPAYWKVSHRVWTTKYEFDDHKYAAKVISRNPLVLQVDTTKELGDNEDEEIPIDPEAPISPATPAGPAEK